MAYVSQLTDRYAFGPFRLDLQRRRILRNELVVSWRSARHFELLRVLIDAEPDVVLYEELRKRVWDGKEIEPQTIAQTIKDLRERLGLYADCIRNQPGKGYYFDRPPSGVLQASDPPLEIVTLLKVATDEWNRRTSVSLLRALKLFRRVVEIDPDCVPGHIGVATCITLGCHIGFAVVAMTELAEARTAVETALTLARDDPSRAAAMSQMAQIRIMYDWRFEEAERLMEEARRLDDGYPVLHQFFAHLYLVTNRWSKVMDAINIARRLAPSSPMFHSTAGLMLHFMRRHEEAIQVGEAAVALHPEFSRGYGMLGMAYEGGGRHDLAVKSFEVAAQIEEHPTALAALGHVCAVTGKRAEARRSLAQLRRMSKTQTVSPYFYALVHAGIGDIDEALQCLEEAYVERCDWLIHAGVEPRWNNIRHAERFRRLLTNVGLPDLVV
jgi:DNA-binding winged helix-turn-helix (wHTH) protein/Flp pilus assembly protein TadD